MQALHEIGVTYFLVMLLVSFWMSNRLARTTHNPPRSPSPLPGRLRCELFTLWLRRTWAGLILPRVFRTQARTTGRQRQATLARVA